MTRKANATRLDAAKDVMHCRPGDILSVDFDHRVGDEITGNHFAVAVQDSPASWSTVIVVPLTSYKGKPLHRGNLYLGSLLWWTGKDSIAKVSQVCCISKERILKHCGFAGSKALEKIRDSLFEVIGRSA
jgi:mRNA-degrading endonuclease toxin of MazEF toxin-antitoxin module